MQDDGLNVLYLIEPGVAYKNSKNRGVNNVIYIIQEIGLNKKKIYSIGLFDVVEFTFKRINIKK